jgi:integrase
MFRTADTDSCAIAKSSTAESPDPRVVILCARHDFETYVLSRTGNLKAVMDAMGHADVKIAMTYQHPELEIVRAAINSRHTLRHAAVTTN